MKPGGTAGAGTSMVMSTVRPMRGRNSGRVRVSESMVLRMRLAVMGHLRRHSTAGRSFPAAPAPALAPRVERDATTGREFQGLQFAAVHGSHLKPAAAPPPPAFAGG